jgi:flagellar motility protein MotE (MotC chaperone)
VFGKNGMDLSVPRQKEHNDMCLAIEKMKEKGRREERRKSLKALEEEREKSSKALEEEREKSLKALEEERKNGICNLIATCRRFGVSLEKACRQLMECYHLTQSEASAYLKEYYV